MAQISSQSKLLGVIGFPIAHSLSPVMHNTAFAALNLDYCYLPLPLRPEELASGVAGLRALGFAGFNATIPHKEQLLNLLDEVSPEAALIGAVNTVVNRNGKLIGYNTDGQGFIRSITELWQYKPQGQKAVILGSGGAAKAVVVALAAQGIAEITIANRDRERAVKLAQQLQGHFACRFKAVSLADDYLDLALSQSSLVVQTTPVGMYPQNNSLPVINPARLYAHNLVYDLIFNPADTVFLVGARSRGCRTANGLGMLLYQGALAFELWTGQAAPIAVMRQALTDKLS